MSDAPETPLREEDFVFLDPYGDGEPGRVLRGRVTRPVTAEGRHTDRCASHR